MASERPKVTSLVRADRARAIARARAADGTPWRQLAARFGVSPRQARRLARQVAEHDRDAARGVAHIDREVQQHAYRLAEQLGVDPARVRQLQGQPPAPSAAQFAAATRLAEAQAAGADADEIQRLEREAAAAAEPRRSSDPLAEQLGLDPRRVRALQAVGGTASAGDEERAARVHQRLVEAQAAGASAEDLEAIALDAAAAPRGGDRLAEAIGVDADRVRALQGLSEAPAGRGGGGGQAGRGGRGDDDPTLTAEDMRLVEAVAEAWNIDPGPLADAAANLLHARGVEAQPQGGSRAAFAMREFYERRRRARAAA